MALIKTPTQEALFRDALIEFFYEKTTSDESCKTNFEQIAETCKWLKNVEDHMRCSKAFGAAQVLFCHATEEFEECCDGIVYPVASTTSPTTTPSAPTPDGTTSTSIVVSIFSSLLVIFLIVVLIVCYKKRKRYSKSLYSTGRPAVVAESPTMTAGRTSELDTTRETTARGQTTDTTSSHRITDDTASTTERAVQMGTSPTVYIGESSIEVDTRGKKQKKKKKRERTETATETIGTSQTTR